MTFEEILFKALRELRVLRGIYPAPRGLAAKITNGIL